MKITMHSDEMNVLLPLSDVAENGIQVCLGEGVELEGNVTVEVSVKIKRDEKFDERDAGHLIPGYTNCHVGDCEDCQVVFCPVYKGEKTFDEYWGKTEEK